MATVSPFETESQLWLSSVRFVYVHVFSLLENTLKRTQCCLYDKGETGVLWEPKVM